MLNLIILIIIITYIGICCFGDWIYYLSEYYFMRENYIVISFKDFVKYYNLKPYKWKLDCCCVYYMTEQYYFNDKLIFIPGDFMKYKKWHRMIKAQNKKLERQMEKEEKTQKQLRNQERYAEILKEMGE